MEMSGQIHAPAALLPGKVPSTHRIGDRLGPQSLSGRIAPVNNLVPVVQPVA
jgi:hypothetical protein